MANWTMQLNTKAAQQALRALKGRGRQAIARALNRATASMRTVQTRGIAKDLGLAQAPIRKAMTIDQATASHHVAKLIATGARIPLYAFKPSPKDPQVRRRTGGVSYRLPGGRGRVPNAFIARMDSGHIGVFVRKGRRRLPIRELFGPSIPQVFGKLSPEALARGQEQLIKETAHELKFALQSSAA